MKATIYGHTHTQVTKDNLERTANANHPDLPVEEEVDLPLEQEAQLPVDQEAHLERRTGS